MEDRQINQTVSFDGSGEPAAPPPGDDAEKNRLLRLLVDVLAESESIYRPTLARALGVSRQLTADLLAELETGGLVTVRGRLNGLPGRSSYAYALRAEAALALAVAASPHGLDGMLVDLRGAVVATANLAGVAAAETLETLLSDLCRIGGHAPFRVRACLLQQADGARIGGPVAALPALAGAATSAPAASIDLPAAARAVLLDVLFG